MTKPALADDSKKSESPCEVRFESGAARAVPDAWGPAMQSVRALVAQLTPATTDCRSISVAPDADGAAVVFTTADGRTARRRIADPRELVPMVEALLVFLDEPRDEPRDGPSAGPPVPLPFADASGPPREPMIAPFAPTGSAGNDAKEPGTKRDAPRPLVGVGGGVKGSFPRDTVSAVGQVFAGVALAHWELAAFGRWELEHDAPVDTTTGHARFSAVGGGAMFGRREALGPLVLIVGTRAAVFDAEEEQKGAHDEPHSGHHDEFLDPRLGLYAGCISSESSRVRFRAQVDADAGLLVHHSEIAQLPAFPRWNLGISIGAEAGFLP